jgi:CRISPR-associated protein Cmr4
VIPGSSLKGVLRDAVFRENQDQASRIFGVQDNAGRLSLGEAKLLAFPVRSAKGSFAFITCPLALERFRREHAALKVSGIPPEPADMSCLAGDTVTISRNGQVGAVLEEYKFARTAPFPADWEAALLCLLDDEVWKVGKGRFVLLSNGDFAHFVKNACEISQHVAIEPETGTAKRGALFNLEAVPAETLFFAPITPLARAEKDLDHLGELLARRSVLQFGGDSTTGLGFCTVKLA